MIPEIVKNIAVVGAGSFFGGAARYLVSLAVKGLGKGGFPWATLAVNLLGCFIIGLLGGFFARGSDDGGRWALFLAVGFCGGFTTFSTFSKESMLMLQAGNVWGFAGYVSLSVAAGVVLVALGYWLCR